MTDLSMHVPTKGLARNKVLVILGVLGVIVISMLAFGIFTPDEDKKISTDESQTLNQNDNLKNTDQLLQEVLAKKQAASAVAKIHNVQIISSESLAMVPPINIKTREPTQEEQAAINYAKAQLTRKYTSLSSKSLLFSSIPTVANSKGNLQHDNTTQQGKSAEVSESSPQIVPKAQFQLDNRSGNNDYMVSGLIEAKSPYEVKAGSIIPAIMLNGLNSDLPGQVTAQVRENVYDSSAGKYLLIPQGAKLVGIYDNHIAYGQERILVAWNRLIYQDGSSINLQAMPGTDLEGYAGFYDEIDNKYWKIFGSSFIMGVITGAMQYSQNNTNANVQSGGIGVTTTPNPTAGQTLSGSLGQQLGQTGLAITQKNLNIQPTLIVKPGYLFNIMLTADISLHPINL
ncbi:MAG: Type secretion system protein virB10 [Burkholderiales bacterium]|jgi:type IV secretion system protein VirB10|nr:Type secretion system protein virB10 [Burkholderiales bacterium]